MWIELGKERPNGFVINKNRTWINTDTIVRVEFLEENNVLTATVVTTKPGGSDRTLYRGDDASRIKIALEHIRNSDNWQPLLDYEVS